MTPFVWMFISSYEHLRSKLLNKNIISSLVQLEYGGFDGATVAVCAFTLQKTHINNYMGSYIRLSDFKGVKNQAPKTLEAIRNRKSYWFYEANQNLFLSIPGKPIAYWVSDSILNSFSLNKSMKDISHSFQGMITGNNDYFLRYWWEVDAGDIKSDACSYEDVKGKQCWLPYSKGGGYRKWFGNNEHVIRWNGTGDDMVRGRTENRKYFFKEGLTWSDIASSLSSFRLQPRSTLFDAKGPTAIFEGNQHYACIGLMNSVFCQKIIEMLNPSVSFQLEEFNKIPIKSSLLGNDELIDAVKKCVSIAKDDWSTKESVLDFTGSAFISIDCRQVALRKLFQENISTDSHMVEKLSALEIKINNLISEAYNFGFSIEEFKLSNVITLTCNPEYEYGTNLIDGEKNAKIQTDKMRSLVSYSIGCMFGRYSVDKKGLVFARSGNDDFEKLVSKETYKTFPADEDGIIPLTNQEWFKDDATNRFREFVQVVWGDDHLQENLDFVAESLCLNAVKPKKSESALETIRRYLSTQFYKDHLKTYKKRPIYWLFSSGKQKAFECLVYLHRYNEGTLARMRTEYVIPLTAKMTAYAQKLENDKEASGSAAEVKRLEKEIAQLHKQQAELSEFDEKLRHYADQRISLDLDDGVKVNYGKFGDLLAEVKAITGEAPEVLS
jgi:type II restriction/modification system DNA methylase subunit YeeA